MDTEIGSGVIHSSLQRNARSSYNISIKNMISLFHMEDIKRIVVYSGMGPISILSDSGHI